MKGRIIEFNTQDQGDQFDAEMCKQQNPWNIFLTVDVRHQNVELQQNFGQNILRFPSPEVMRIIAGFLNDHAGKWERGELPGLNPPEKSPGKTVTEGA